jgi:AhpD family alkylhydroperoxidase
MFGACHVGNDPPTNANVTNQGGIMQNTATIQPRMPHIVSLVPEAYQAMLAFGKSAKRGGVPATTGFLVHLRASQINRCSFCAEMHSRELKDKHLRSPDFFDVARHPRIVFTATAVTARDGGLTCTGELAVGSSRLRPEIPLNVEQTADGALRLEGKTTVSREAAGVDWNILGMIRRDAMLYAKLTLKRATS